MSLSLGTRLGVYEILAKLGEGGMGEVYRARDTTLDRDVALKLLPAAFSNDADRLARLDREAKTLASLNHPNIAQIYGLENSAGVRAIVMELVEGEDLAERLRRGALPIDEALNAAKQIAEALEAAHGAGVIHRDLKPANVKIRPDGAVKVLDFGLAKPSRESSPGNVLANSPTMTSPLMTGVGVILGTAAYMSPEQAKGRPVDKRADVWAFGCLLFEMLTGQSLFAAEDVAQTIAAVLTREPKWTQLPAETPEPITRLLRRCIVRDPRQRLSDIGVARFEIDDALSGAQAPAVPRQLKRRWPVAIAAGMLGIAIGGATAFNWLRTETPLRMLPLATHSQITAAQLSPDGRYVAYVQEQRLVVRSIETAQESVFPPEDGVSNPFWSWDSTRVGYLRQSELGPELRFVLAKGGDSQRVIGAAQGVKDRPSPAALWGGTWCRAGIVFVDGNARRTMRMVSESGQDIKSFDSFDAADAGNLAYPHCLPNGRILAVRATNNRATLVVVTEKGETKLLAQDITFQTDVRWPVLVGSDVVFEQMDPTQGLWKFPVNEDLTAATGPARILLPDASRPSAGGGMLTALTGVRTVDRNLVWVNQTGKRLGSLGKPQREFMTPSLSASADKVITGGRRQKVWGLWMHTRDTAQQWHDEGRVGGTAWSPDSKHIAFVIVRDPGATRTELIVRSVAGDERYPITGGGRMPTWFDNIELFFFRGTTLWRGPATEGAAQRQIPIENAREASISLDRKLIAYAVNTGGRSEVFVAPLEHLENVTQISIGTDGGRYPLWTNAGLFFACGPPVGDTPGASRAICLATVDLTSGTMRGKPTQLFNAAALGFTVIIYSDRGYDVTKDGARILVQTDGREGTPSIMLIENAKSWLKSRVP